MAVRLTILLLFMIIHQAVRGQLEGNIWIIPEQTGMDFNCGFPSQIFTNFPIAGNGPGFSNICDSSGQLLFYSDGSSILNRDAKFMPNGEKVLSKAIEAAFNENVHIVPHPGNIHQYYVFSYSCDDTWINGFSPCNTSLSYALVDMRLDNGAGDVVWVKKDVLLMQEGDNSWIFNITATRDLDRQGFWLLATFVQGSSTSLCRFHITADSIEIDTLQTLVPGGYFECTQFSPDGQKFGILTGNSLYLYDFNNSDGTIGSQTQIAFSEDWWTFTFSPDATKIYCGRRPGGFTSIR